MCLNTTGPSSSATVRREPSPMEIIRSFPTSSGPLLKTDNTSKQEKFTSKISLQLKVLHENLHIFGHLEHQTCWFYIVFIARHAYLATMKKFEWHKVASLTQDGSKYSHYMSSLQDVLQQNGIDFVINRKYQRDTIDMSLVRLSFRL